MRTAATILKWAGAIVVAGVIVYLVVLVVRLVQGIASIPGAVKNAVGKPIIEADASLGSKGHSPWWLNRIATWFKYS